MGWWSILLSLTYLDGGLTTSLILLKRLRTSVELVFNILRMKKSETQVEGWRHQDRDLHMLVLKPFEATVGANVQVVTLLHGKRDGTKSHES
ncbi:uncharacterized protein [Triticum aestivum]|uniref:uncharacterized protein isoform X2 n=1 Tax=Triticum aestivum TaxID=4565 RepID=UPI001D030658|nr:uncharacterized protein LOC123080251 isoform X2 [Triticum aestivum]